MIATLEYASPLASWPRGLSLFLDSGIYIDSVDIGPMLWREAAYLKKAESLEMMLPFVKQVTAGHWNDVTRAYYCGDREDPSWESVFHLITEQLWKTCAGDTISTLSGIPSDISIGGSRLYHTDLSTLALESLWKVGFRDLDRAESNPYDPDPILVGTPLWRGSLAVNYWTCPEVCMWLIAKGANVHWRHPLHSTTPAHVLIRSVLRSGDVLEGLRALEDIPTMPDRDECSCHCSVGGCSIIGCACSENSFPHSWWIFDKQDLASFQQITRPYLYSLADTEDKSAWMASAILRVLTFEDLRLTHTCCYRVYDEVAGDFTRPTREEAQDIYEAEHGDINLLNRLMEDFEHAWEHYPDTFVSFVNTVWKSRMKRERKRKRQSSYKIPHESAVVLRKAQQPDMSTKSRRYKEVVSESETDDDEEIENWEDGQNACSIEEDNVDGFVTASEGEE